MKRKTWDEVAHHYTTSDIQLLNETGKPQSCKVAVSIGYLDQWKPILQHLDDITDEQAFEYAQMAMEGEYVRQSGDVLQFCHKEKYWSHKGFPDYKNHWFKITYADGLSEGYVFFAKDVINPVGFDWLTRNGFDLFGLIELGEAERR